MDEKEVKSRIRDWMYKWGYSPKGFPIFPTHCNGLLDNGKSMIPFYDSKVYDGIGYSIIVDDLFELEIPNLYRGMVDYPFKFGKYSLPPKSIAFEYKGYNNGNVSSYTAIGQAMVYHCLIKEPVYLVIDIEGYLRLNKVFDVLPFGIVCYRVKGIDDGIKVIKHSDRLLSI